MGKWSQGFMNLIALDSIALEIQCIGKVIGRGGWKKEYKLDGKVERLRYR